MRASVVLPQPDSPTTPSTSFWRHSRSTPSSALHAAPAPAELDLEPARLGQRRDGGGQGSGAHRTPPPTAVCVKRREQARRLVVVAHAAAAPSRRASRPRARGGSAGGSGSRRADRRDRAVTRGSPAAAPARCPPAGTRRAAAACTGAAAPRTRSPSDPSRRCGPHTSRPRDRTSRRSTAEVVRDQEQRQAQVAPQLLEQREHLRLRHHVECRRRLVGDDRPRDRRPGPARSSPAGACHPRTRADTGGRARG